MPDNITPLSKENLSTLRCLDMLSSSLGADIGALLKDDTVVEIMRNADGKIWADRLGEGMFDTGCYLNAEGAGRVIRLIATTVGKVCTEEAPSLSATLPGTGERFQAIIPPASVAPLFSIRKKARRVFTLQDYVTDGIMDAAQADLIHQAVADRKNILVVGGTGSGKTTLLNAILHAMAQTGHRILTIEDTPELQCTAANYVSLMVREPVYTVQMAVKDALRLRPDRIVVGEVRDGSALDLLKAWNTGHNGGVATVHANSAREGLSRLEQLIGEVSVNIPRQLIADAIDVVIYIERTKTGRKVEEVTMVMGLDREGYMLQMGNT